MNRIVCLVVDNQENSLSVVENLLQQRFPEVILLKSCGAEQAMGLLSAKGIDFAIIAMEMPGIDALQLCRHIKGDALLSPIHVMMVTSYMSSSELGALCLEAGADDFLSGSKDEMEISARIHATLRIIESERALLVANRKLKTALAENEAELYVSEEQLALYAALTSDAIFTFDDSNQLIYVNEAAAHLLHVERKALIGRDVFSIIPEDEHSRHAATFRDFFIHDKDNVADLPLVLASSDGVHIPVEASITAWSRGGKTCMTMVVRDQRQRLQEKKEKEVIQLQLFEAQKLETVATVAGGMAHDLNNVLSGLDLNLVLLRRSVGEMSEDSIGFYDILRNEVRRARSVTGRILAFARKKADSHEIVRVQVNQYIEELGKFFRGMLPDHVSLVVEDPGDELDLDCDAGLLEQLLLNLMINARDAIEQTGTIVLRARLEDASGDNILFEVQDDGGGIAPEVLPHIFEPFFSTKGSLGTGLGLSVVKNMSEMIGGTIKVTSEPGKGSTFALILPRRQSVSSLPAAEKPQRLEGIRVLVLEDDSRLGGALQEILEINGLSVNIATNLVEARKLMQQNTYDLLLADLSLPDGVSLPLLHEMQRTCPRMAILPMSGYSENSQVVAGIDRLPFLAKPFTLETLLTAIRGAMARGDVSE